MVLTYKERTVRGRKVFWYAFGVLVVVEAILLLVAYRFWGIQRDPLVDPVLKGAPQFIVLSLVVAFAVYLRQVSTNASELRDKIKEGNVWNYPPGAAHSKLRMEALDGISENISVAAPFMIMLTIASAGRIVFDALLKFPRFATYHVNWVLFLIDLGLALWVFFLFLALAIVHTRGRKRDEVIRVDTRANKDDCLRNRERAPTLNSDAELRAPVQGPVPQSRPSSLFSGIMFALALLLLVRLPRHE